MLNHVRRCTIAVVWALVEAAPTASAELNDELQVIVAAPQGEVPVTGRIAVAFKPPLEGQVLWRGTSAFEFVPRNNTLPYASHFDVSVNQGVKDLQGRMLRQSVRFQFDTPPVAVSFETSTKEWLLPTDPVHIAFVPAVATAELRRCIHAVAEANKTISPLGFEIYGFSQPRTEYVPIGELKLVADIQLVPNDHWPYLARISVTVDETLHVPDGPRPLGRRQQITYRTPEPFRIWLDCGASGCRNSEPDVVSNRSLDPERDLRLYPHLGPLRFYDGNPPTDTDEEPEASALLALEHRYKFHDLHPLTEYRLSVVEPLESDEVLTGARAWRFRTPGLEPSVDWEPEAKGGIVETALLRGISVRGAGGPPVAVQSRPLLEEDFDKLIEQAGPSSIDPWTLQGEQSSNLLGNDCRTVISKTSQLAQTHRQLTNRELFGEESPLGPWLLGAQSVTGKDEAPVALRLLQPTSLGVTAYNSPSGLRVWVRNRATGQPVPLAEVKLHDANSTHTTFWHDVTSLGETRFAPNELEWDRRPTSHQRPWLSVRHGNDWVAMPLKANASPSDDSDITSTLWSDRDLYGPEETVHLFGIVRKWRDPEMQPVKNAAWQLEVGGYYHGAEKTKLETVTDAHGFFSVTYRIPKGVTGGVRVTAGPPDGSTSARREFMVEPYVPTPVQLTFRGLKPEYRDVSSIDWQLEGMYLTGAPAIHAKITSQLFEYITTLSTVSDEWQVSARHDFRNVDLPENRLDDAGFAKEQYTFEGDVFGPEVVLIDSAMTDITGRSYRTHHGAQLFRSRFFVGLRQSGRAWPWAGQPFALDVAAFTPEGDFVPDVTVELTLDGVDRFDQMGSHNRQFKVRTGTGPARIWLEVPIKGNYQVHATATDRNLKVHSELRLYVRDATRLETEFYDERSVRAPSLTALLDREMFRPGDTVQLTAYLPFTPARVHLLVGRDEILHQEERIVSDRVAVFRIPTARSFGRNVRVSLLAHRLGGRHSVTEPYPFAFDEWHEELQRNPASYRLGVEVIPNHALASPGDWITVDVLTKDALGAPHPSVITLYAVDEGNLLLTDYQTPDPLPNFARPRPTLFTLWDNDQDICRFGFPGRFGHGAGTAGGQGYGRSGRTRRPGVTTAFFRSGLSTDRQGRAQVQFQLPDDLSRYRIMAVAASDDDDYGRGEATVTNRKPLSIRAVAPAVAWYGDTFEAELAVTSFLAEPSNVTVHAKASGLLIHSLSTQKLRILPRHTEVVRFLVQGVKVGKAWLSFESKSDDAMDAVQQDLIVREPIDTSTVAAYGKTSSHTQQSLGRLGSSGTKLRQLDVEIGNSALTAVPGTIEKLRAICASDLSQQTTETVAIGLFAEAGLSELKRRVPTHSTSPDCVARLLKVLSARQCKNGVFSVFEPGLLGGGAGCDNIELTAFVTWVLDRLSQPQAQPSKPLEKALKYWRRRAPSEFGEAPLALGLWVLANHDAVPKGAWKVAFDNRIHWTAEGRAWLSLAASKISEATPEQREQLKRELAGAVRLTADRAEVVEQRPGEDGNYRSGLSDTASVLSAYLELDPKNGAVEPLVRGLAMLQAKESDELAQTWTLAAMNEYLRQRPNDLGAWQARVKVGTQTIVDTRSERGLSWGSRSLLGPDIKALDKLDFDLVTGESLYYLARLTLASKELPVESINRGFAIEQVVYRVARNESTRLIDGRVIAVKQGDTLRIELEIALPSPRHGVWVEVPLPTQLELTDRLWRNTENWVASEHTESPVTPSFKFHEAGKLRFYLDRPQAGLARLEYFVRASFCGVGTTPPVTVSEVHRPEIYGRTGLRRWEVTR